MITMSREATLTAEEKMSIWLAARWTLVDGDEIDEHLATSCRPHVYAAAQRYWRFVQRSEVRRARSERSHMRLAAEYLVHLQGVRPIRLLENVVYVLTRLNWGWSVNTISWEDGGPNLGETPCRPYAHVYRNSPYRHIEDIGDGEHESFPVHEYRAETPAAALLGAFKAAVMSWHDRGPADDPSIRELLGDTCAVSRH